MNKKIVTREEWLKARTALLKKEKEFTQLRDQMTSEVRRLPWVKVDKQYAFDGPQGAESLTDLFWQTHPACGLSLYARARLGSGLQELLILGGQFSRNSCSPRE